MSIEGDLTPAPQPDSGQPLPPAAPAVSAAPQSWFLRHRRLLIPAGAVLALGAVSAAAVLILAKQTSTIEKMVPASADVIAVANLDPSVAQKVNLLRAMHSFPDYKTDKGITISVGTPTDKSAQTAAYSFVDHVVVFATTSVQIHEIIDTDQGRAAKLIDLSDFKATLAALPADRLGYLYVNGRSLVAGVKKQMATTPAVSLALKNLNDVDALQGIGATLSANGDGILADVLVKVDQSKLSPATRDAFAHAGKADVVVKWIPQTSEGFLAITGLNRTIQAALDQSGNQASVKAATDSIGLTGTAGLLPHLTGDAGLEVEFSGSGLPAGAILLGTNDAKSMNAFFAKLLVLAEGAVGSSFGSTPAATAGHVTTTTYGGVMITTWTSPALGGLGASALSPSYAVLAGMGILASTPAEVKAIIDTHKSGASIASD